MGAEIIIIGIVALSIAVGLGIYYKSSTPKVIHPTENEERW